MDLAFHNARDWPGDQPAGAESPVARGLGVRWLVACMEHGRPSPLPLDDIFDLEDLLHAPCGAP